MICTIRVYRSSPGRAYHMGVQGLWVTTNKTVMMATFWDRYTTMMT